MAQQSRAMKSSFYANNTPITIEVTKPDWQRHPQLQDQDIQAIVNRTQNPAWGVRDLEAVIDVAISS